MARHRARSRGPAAGRERQGGVERTVGPVVAPPRAAAVFRSTAVSGAGPAGARAGVVFRAGRPVSAADGRVRRP